MYLYICIYLKKNYFKQNLNKSLFEEKENLKNLPNGHSSWDNKLEKKKKSKTF